MRDLLAEAWKQRERAPTDTRETPSRRRSRSTRALLAGVLVFVLGVSAGALPFVLSWSGQGAATMSFERALGMALDSRTKAEHLSGLRVRLVYLCETGMKSITSLARIRPQMAGQVTAAFDRLERRLQGAQPADVAKPDFPTWISFHQGLTTLQDASSRRVQLAQCLEVVVHNIEQTLGMFKDRAKSPGVTGEGARFALMRLRATLNNR